MMIRYKTLFSIDILHNFYANGASRDFALAPTDETVETLRSFDLLFRPTSRGATVLYQVQERGRNDSVRTRPLGDDALLTFKLIIRNNAFLNYTDLPIDHAPNEIYYFSNLTGNKQTTGPGGSDQLLLTQWKDTAFASKRDRLELWPQRFQFEAQTGKRSTLLEVKSQVDASLVKKRIYSIADPAEPDKRKFSETVNLLGRRPQKVRLFVDDKREMKFYADDRLYGKTLFGVIAIFRHSKVSRDYAFEDDPAKDDFPTYTLRFNRRQSIWRYNVILKNQLRDSDPHEWPADWPSKWSISYPPDEAVAITPQTNDIYQATGGFYAVPFVSNRALPFASAPVSGMRLQKKNGNGNGTGHGHGEGGDDDDDESPIGAIREVANLPAPDFANLKPGKDSNVSEINIYV
ncbi:MAG: hypothetical protein GF398_17790 [Chitinivibrionales bacterium]|nr:hypothetical protein [Chitinivibrionales bacterium]